MTVAVWFIASIGIGRIYPAVVQQLTVVPNEFAQESPYIANNIAMTRLAFDLDGWEVRNYRGEAPLTEAKIQEHQATFLNARLWDYRPLGDTLEPAPDRSATYYEFVDVDTDRYPLGDETRQVMLSMRELALDKNPEAAGWVNERVNYTHGIGVTMVPVNEIATQGQPRLIIRDLPPISSAGAPAITEPRVYFGERESSYVVVGARQAEFDYPRGQTATGSDVVVETRWQGTTGIKLDTTLSRLLFALRFRDLNLLISDQITSDSQLLFHRYTEGPAAADRAIPALRQGPVRRHQGRRPARLHPGCLHRERPVPARAGVQPGASSGTTGLGGAPLNYIRNSVKIVMDAYDGTMSFYVNDASGSAHPGLAGRVPDPVPADVGIPRRPPGPSPRAGGAVQRPDAGLRPLSRPEPAHLLRRRTTCGRCRSVRRARTACRARPTT